MLKYQELISKMTLEEKCYMFSGGNFWQSRSVKRLGIPPMVMSDGPHGVLCIMPAVHPPKAFVVQ